MLIDDAFKGYTAVELFIEEWERLRLAAISAAKEAARAQQA